MDTKICLHCNQEKSLESYGTFKNRDNSIGYRNVCRECQNKQRREREGKQKQAGKLKILNQKGRYIICYLRNKSKN